MKKKIFFLLLLCSVLQLRAENQNFSKGLELLDAKKYREAVEAFTLAIQEMPANPFFWERRGYAYLCDKDFYPAINDFTLAILLAPQNPLYCVQRALAYHESGNPNAMKNDLIDAAQMGEPNAQEFLRNNGIAW